MVVVQNRGYAVEYRMVQLPTADVDAEEGGQQKMKDDVQHSHSKAWTMNIERYVRAKLERRKGTQLPRSCASRPRRRRVSRGPVCGSKVVSSKILMVYPCAL